MRTSERLTGRRGLRTLVGSMAIAMSNATAISGVVPWAAIPTAHADIFAKIREYKVPTPGYESPADITTGPDGNLWFTEFDAHKVGRITPAGVITEFPVHGSPTAITVGGDSNLWVLESEQGMIGRISATGMVTEFPVAGLFYPQGVFEGLVLGPDNNVWFTDSVNPSSASSPRPEP